MSHFVNQIASSEEASFYVQLRPEVIQAVRQEDPFLAMALRVAMSRLAKVSPRYVGHIAVAGGRVGKNAVGTPIVVRAYMTRWDFGHQAQPTMELVPENLEECKRGLLVRFKLNPHDHGWAYFSHEFTEVVRQ